MSGEKGGEYGIGRTGATGEVEAPELPYGPRDPAGFRPGIGLVGCGGISEMHLRAYRHAGYDVVALCSRSQERAQKRRQEFFPGAAIYTDYRQLLRRDDVQVVDIATHPEERVPIVEAALEAGKHVLSQKPFAVDLDVGERLVEKAQKRGVLLAVNQNGRWAPHFSYVRRALQAGLLGRVCSAQFSVHWDHNWVAGSSFDQVEDLVLYDFGIHWFDMALAFMGGKAARRVYASAARSPGQRARPPLMAQALIECEDAQVSLFFNGDTRQGQEDRTCVVGTKATALCRGVDLTQQEVLLYAPEGVARPRLEGTWFREGFHGTMAELLCAVEEGRAPENNAADNLQSLALCFAAVESAHRGAPVAPGSVRRLPGS